MKKKIIKISIILLVIAIIAIYFPEQALAAAKHMRRAHHSSNALSVQKTVIKFLIAMGGVLISSLVLYFGLSVYNKIRAKKLTQRREEKPYSELDTPKTTDEAIDFFINQNKL